MRIFLTFHPSANLSVPDSMTWYRNLYEPLLDIGHEVVLLRMDQVAQKYNVKFRGTKFKEVYSNELISKFRKEQNLKPFDLFLSYLTDLDVEEGAIQTIKIMGVPMANFSCNNTHQFYIVEKISPLFDYNLHSEKDADIKFKGVVANPVWFPMAANPKYYFPVRKDFKFDVSFIGAAYAKRAYYIYHLVQNGISVDCFGPNWLINRPYIGLKRIKKEANRTKWVIQSLFNLSSEVRYKKSLDIYHYDLLVKVRKQNESKMHYPCSDYEMIRIINASKIILGFLEVYSGVENRFIQQHLHLREFEIPMCGGLYITNYSDELSEFFELDKEVLCFYNEYDLTDKIKYFLKHERAAEKIRVNGFSRAIKDHTYQKRFKDLFSKINLKD